VARESARKQATCLGVHRQRVIEDERERERERESKQKKSVKKGGGAHSFLASNSVCHEKRYPATAARGNEGKRNWKQSKQVGRLR
jgi:hypothetical protein